MGRAADAWNRLSSMLTSADFDGAPELYAVDALYLEPHNPPHRGNLLIQAYLNDTTVGRTNLEVDVKRVVESADGRTVGVEYALSYDAAGRRWTGLPRATFIELDDTGAIEYQRDYT